MNPRHFSAPIPLSLYIHIPWCVQKCPYCDFNSHAARGATPEAAYVDRLIDDLDAALPHIWGRSLISIFLGGGTPSLFAPESIDRLLTAVKARLRVSPDTEITLEANPGTVDESRFVGFREAGVNRLSIGVQSFQDKQLKILGRIHDSDHAKRAIESAKRAGFDNFNIDLMYGLSNQTEQEALEDVETALAFNPPHVSRYQLTIEPNTFFYKNPPKNLPQDDALWEMQIAGKARLAQAGLQQYEVSAYAAPDRACQHNKNYWEFGDYLGIGAGAHSKLTNMDKNEIVRHWQIKNPTDYLNRDKNMTAQTTIINKSDSIFEFMLNALRLTEGVPSELLSARTGLSLSVVEPALQIAKQKKLLVDDDSRLCATPLGQAFLNDLVSVFLV